jgi:hypothetical protein
MIYWSDFSFPSLPRSAAGVVDPGRSLQGDREFESLSLHQ